MHSPRKYSVVSRSSSGMILGIDFLDQSRVLEMCLPSPGLGLGFELGLVWIRVSSKGGAGGYIPRIQAWSTFCPWLLPHYHVPSQVLTGFLPEYCWWILIFHPGSSPVMVEVWCCKNQFQVIWNHQNLFATKITGTPRVWMQSEDSLVHSIFITSSGFNHHRKESRWIACLPLSVLDPLFFPIRTTALGVTGTMIATKTMVVTMAGTVTTIAVAETEMIQKTGAGTGKRGGAWKSRRTLSCYEGCQSRLQKTTYVNFMLF